MADKTLREVCVSAAVRLDNGTILQGRRHHECMAQANCYVRQDQQGFVTSTGRFVDREEAARLHSKIGKLYSEDLW